MSQRVRGRPASRKAGVLRCGKQDPGSPGSAPSLGRALSYRGERIRSRLFSGCGLRCVFCQNYEIARAAAGEEIPEERLAEIFLELQDQGAGEH